MRGNRRFKEGAWRLRVEGPRNPLTGTRNQVHATVHAPDTREGEKLADIELAKLVVDVNAGRRAASKGSFGELIEEWYGHKAANNRMSPSSLLTARNIIDAYLRRPLGHTDADKITTRTLDLLYRGLHERGGACTQRPCARPRNCGIRGHAEDCRRQRCIAAWRRPTRDGACASWVPCDESPCEHGGPLAVSSVRRIHVVVRSALEQGVRWGWVPTNPAEHADPGQVLEEDIDSPEDPDVIRLLAEAEETDFRLAAYLATAIESGARRGAMHALRWTYFELQPDGTATIRFPKVISVGPDGPVERPATRTKRSGRKVTLGPHVTAMLIRHHDDMSAAALAAGATLPSDAFIFSNDILGRRPWRPEHTSSRFRRLGRAVNLDNETQLRHLRDLMATKLLSARVNPKIIGERGGWRRLATMLDRYARWVPADDRDAAGVVDRLLGAARLDDTD